MQNLIDLFVAGFVFVLFASVYRKRRTVAVRCWMTGWFFILLHFFALVWPVHGPAAETVQAVSVVCSLVLCALSFALSREEIRESVGRGCLVLAALGVPWLSAAVLGSLPQPPLATTAICAYTGVAAIVFVAVGCLRKRVASLIGLLLVAAACGTWLTTLVLLRRLDLVVYVVLTQCFAADAVLLSFAGRRLTMGTVTTSCGAFAWGAVWSVALAMRHYLPALALSPEIWNVPKYLVASGMILTLLEEEIRAAAQVGEQYRLLFAGHPHPIWVYDPETLKVIEGNEAAMAQYGYGAKESGAMSLLEVFVGDAQDGLMKKLRGAGPEQLSGPWSQRRRDGSTLQADIASQRVVKDGRTTMFALMHDVTQREQLHAQLVRQAHHDPLTGLPNRVAFEQRFGEALESAERAGDRLALFCIDLDRFKQVNDTLGHAAGDLVLQEVAGRLRRRLGRHGTLARHGGDEFMLLLCGMIDPGEAEVLASDLLRELKQPVHSGKDDLEIACSIGFSLYPEDGREGDQLWRDADAAMYQAKRAGGGQWVRVSHEISSSATQAQEIEVHLRRVLRSGEIEVHYQPQFDPHGHFLSMEALFRLPDPVAGHLPTDRIIAVAEESSLIVPLGRWVLEEVCRQCRSWLDEGISPSQVAVNVSPLQLTRFDFARQVSKLLEKYRLNARMLEFEVTESTMMPDRSGDAPHQIATLARMGIRFAVDDFGTGYSSLGRLHQLPVDSLKIDQSFTRRIAEHNGTYPTVEAIMALAHTFGMKVCAEGVETEEQLRLLRALRCDRVQGFLLSKPLSAAQATEWLRMTTAEAGTESVA